MGRVCNGPSLLWAEMSSYLSKLPKRMNLEKTGEVVQTEGASRKSSRPLQEGIEASAVTIQSVSDVEVPFSLALTAGSNRGAQLSEHWTARNGPGSSSQSMCRGEPDVFPGDQQLRPPQSPLRRQAVRHDDRVDGSRSRSRHRRLERGHFNITFVTLTMHNTV